LYDLSKDISQHSNLIAEYPEKADELRQELKRIKGQKNNSQKDK
jgi:hypothetical protein